MRLFTGIDLPPEVQSRLKVLLDRLRPTARIAWSPAKNMHITTKFIGEWPEARLDEMKSALGNIRAVGAFNIAVRGLGWFPNPRSPRVFWAGIEAGSELQSLARETEEAAAALGVAKENRKFSPHLTLARIRERVPLEALRRTIEELPSVEFGSFRVSSFYLYLSAGGKYTKLAEFATA